MDVIQTGTRAEDIYATVNYLRIICVGYLYGPTRVSEYCTMNTSRNNTVHVEGISSDMSIIKIRIGVVPLSNVDAVSELLECGIKLSSHYNLVL